ncbi:MAG: hypothetical protein NZL90_01635 [Aquificaceae bacterium]|nr:hypothetical protein [Aquificaceae bacterium]
MNPTFGEGSSIVGGADADLVIDDMIVDIKVTKHLKFAQGYYNQLVGYFVLSKIDSVYAKDDERIATDIKRVAIYYARHGYLHVIIDKRSLSKFIRWLEKRAAEMFLEKSHQKTKQATF